MAYDSWRLEVSSADPDAVTPTWVNLTSRVRTVGSGVRPVQIRRGAGSEREDVQPSTLTAFLENSDHALTPGNPSSPYLSWWGQRRRCRFVETVLGVDYVRFTGFTNPSDLADWAEPGVEQLVTFTAVDWLGRLDTAPEFESTLGEHVRTQGGTLREWWTLADPTPFRSALTDNVGTVVVNGFKEAVQLEPRDLLRATGKPGPPGDDLSYALWQPALDSNGAVTLAWSYVLAPISVAVGATDTVAVSVWVNATTQPVTPPALRAEATFLMLYTSGFGLALLDEIGGLTATVTGAADVVGSRELERDVWRLVTLRVNFATGAIDLWCGADLVATGTGTLPAGTTLTNMLLSGNFAGALGQIQVRVGSAAATMTRQMHLDQYAHGRRGLERQTAAERIATVAAYAGVPAADLTLDAAAATPMQSARLARGRPTAAMRAAATTEGGRLFVTGPGKIRLRARAARYNQPVTLQIPYRWLSRGLRMREDKPVNDVTASQPSGASTRRRDQTSINRYGVGSDPVTLETAVDADLGNRAAWTVQAYATPRVRCPQLVIDLLPLTDAQRAQLLALDIGDRIEVTGGPATIPPAARHLIVEGFAPDEVGVETRSITLNTSPLLGAAAGSPPASVMVGDLVSTTAVIAY